MTSGEAALDADALAVHRALDAEGPLRELNDAGLLSAGEIRIARRLAALAGEDDVGVLAAAALAVRAPAEGHVYADLAQTSDAIADVLDGADAPRVVDAPWADSEAWRERLAASPLVVAGEGPADGDGSPRPLRLVASRLYLDRYWREEVQIAADLAALADGAPAGIDEVRLNDGLRRLFADGGSSSQEAAVRAAVEHRLTVVAGAPGSGKTTTVARIAALLADQQPERRLLLALAAPTGKAAMRLQDAVHAEAGGLDVDANVRAQLAALEATTIHRLLGWRPGHHVRFKHDRTHHLPHDAVIVDEASMLSLTLMARLLEALRPDARLVLVGDPDQLASVEAGSVLADLVGAGGFGDAAAVRLTGVHRYGAGIAAVADAVRSGDADAVVEALAAGADGVTWIAADIAEATSTNELALVRDRVVAAARAVAEAAQAGDAGAALAALAQVRLLCAHRRGPYGVAHWLREVESWIAAGSGSATRHAIGRPLLVTENDYGLQLFNGDVGVVVAGADGRPVAVFKREAKLLEVPPAQLDAVEAAYAMTVHKCQGSQFGTAIVVLPPPGSRLLTRELLYTAVTRPRAELMVVGTEASIRAAVARPAARASGLRERLQTQQTPTA
jgi:exodeoxyribonuclease V alpha subunit